MGERVCVTDALGFSPGGDLSPGDVSLIYQEVFHYPSTTEDVLVAMKKVAGEDKGVSCVGENILDVLLEMQKEKERKDELCWSQQLLTVGKHKDGDPNNTEGRWFQQVPDFMLSSSAPSTSKHAQNILHPGSLPSGSDHTDVPQTERDRRRVLHLKRSARRCWSRLVTEGVHSIAPRQYHPTALEFRGHALGCLTTADLLSVLEVKYDAVTRLLYTEMLRQHFGLSDWENLLPWQRDKEMEGLEELAELALGSGDLLDLTQLPGVFRIYKIGSSQSAVQSCWSAVNVLTEAYASLQREKASLTRLSRRLDRDSLKLAFLYIRLSTFRAQSERWSYGALLAASQLWESWPCVGATRRQEMVQQWLSAEDQEGDREMCLSASPQQAVLQLLVLTQKAERESLVGLLRRVSLDKLEGPESPGPVTDENQQRRCSLKDRCLRRLQQIRSSLQTRAPFQECSPPADSAPRPVSQPPQNQSPGAAGGSSQWGDAVTLLRQLADAQENQVSLLLPSLLHMSIEHLQVLREKYRSEFQTQHFSDLLNFLSPDITESSLVEVRSESTPISHSGQIKDRNRNAGLHNKSAAEPWEPDVPSAEEPGSSGSLDLCTGCGASLEGLPYLEIISGPGEGPPPEGEEPGREEEEPGREAGSHPEGEEPGREAGSHPEGEEPGREAGSHPEGEEPGREAGPRGTQEGCEKQASLIALAWSKRTEEDGEERSTAGPTAGTAGHMEALEEPVSAVQMHNSKKQQETPKSSSGGDFQEHAFALENGAVAVVRHPVPSAEIQQQFQQETNTTAHHRMQEAGREQAEEDVCSVQSVAEPWAHAGHHLPDPPTSDADLPEEATAMEAGRRNDAGGPVWWVESERTMHTLVEMQRKVEERQQRDRDRQLLRVQERLAIIHNKKAEEDLLGLKQKETLEQLTHNLPQEDKSQQKSVVRARLDQLRRERSCVMQSKRDRNTTGFKELLGPVVRSTDAENGTE